MQQIIVRVEVNNREELMKLFQSVLLEEYNPQTGILFKEGCLFLKLCFENDVPKQSISAFLKCGVIEYLESNYSPEEAEQCLEFSAAESKETASVNGETPQLDTDNYQKGTEAETFGGELIVGKEPVEVLETADDAADEKKGNQKGAFLTLKLKELLEESTSTESYLDRVAEVMEIPEKQKEIFINLVQMYPSHTEIMPKWTTLVKLLKDEGIECTTYDRKALTTAATKTFGVRFLKVISTMAQLLWKNSEWQEKAVTEDTTTVLPEISTPSETATTVEASEDTLSTKETIAEEQLEDTKGCNPCKPGKLPVSYSPTVNKYEKLFSCMPDMTEAGNLPEVKNLEELINKSKRRKEETDFTAKVRIQGVILDLCRAYGKDVAKSHQEVDALRAFAERLMAGEPICTGIREQSDRILILRWAKIANAIAKLYNPEAEEAITAEKFLLELKELLS